MSKYLDIIRKVQSRARQANHNEPREQQKQTRTEPNARTVGLHGLGEGKLDTYERARTLACEAEAQTYEAEAHNIAEFCRETTQLGGPIGPEVPNVEKSNKINNFPAMADGTSSNSGSGPTGPVRETRGKSILTPDGFGCCGVCGDPAGMIVPWKDAVHGARHFCGMACYQAARDTLIH